MSDQTPMPKPTAQVEVYADVLGPEKAVDFLLKFGGANLDFAKNPGPQSALVKAVGLEKARELGRRMNHTRRRIPTAKPWLAQALKSRGLSGAEISRKLLTTDVTVRKWLNKARSDWDANPAQLSLFPDED